MSTFYTQATGIAHIQFLTNFICGYDTEFPFEFRALEVALEGVCSYLDTQTRELETAAYPALDELTSKVRLEIQIQNVCLIGRII